MNPSAKTRLIRRVTLLVAFLAFAAAFYTALNPRLERVEHCINPILVTGTYLKSKTHFGRLFYTDIGDPSLQSAIDIQLIKPFSASGYLTGFAPSKASLPIGNDDAFSLTGVIYLRYPSLPERWISNAKRKVFYEAAKDGKVYLLGGATLTKELWPLCEEALIGSDDKLPDDTQRRHIASNFHR